MKNYGKKCVVVLAALVIALGVVMTITGCKKSTPPAEPPEKKAAEKTTE
jgi:hypothetical protein